LNRREFLNADKFLTDDWEQTKHFKTQGALQDGPPKLYAELGKIVAGEKPGREKERERILAINIGLALNDIIVANHVYELAKKKKSHTKLTLIPWDIFQARLAFRLTIF